MTYLFICIHIYSYIFIYIHTYVGSVLELRGLEFGAIYMTYMFICIHIYRCIYIHIYTYIGSVLELRDIEFGATCLKWSPCGCMLWGGGRAHTDLICWDLRHTRQELGRYVYV
jgi:hypothetical protein